MTVFKVVVDPPEGAHSQIRVFAGKDQDHLALLGTLRALPEEAEDFAMVIRIAGNTLAGAE